MSIQLLDKTRKINKLLHNNSTSKFVFSDICGVLSETLYSNVLVVSKKGKVLGISEISEIEKIEEMLGGQIGDYVDSDLNERLLGILSTKENVNLLTLGFASKNISHYNAIISPIDIAGERLGTLFVYRMDEPFQIDDIIISEYGTTVVGLEMVRSVSEENEIEMRNKHAILAAMSTLSQSEISAIKAVIAELDRKNEGLIVASHISERVGITRSVIVNALRKFESAGIIETRSNGMRGTSIKVLVSSVFDYVN